MILQNELNFIFNPCDLKAEMQQYQTSELERKILEFSTALTQLRTNVDTTVELVKYINQNINKTDQFIAADTTETIRPLEIFEANNKEDFGYINFYEQ